jgi:hypothetical protein
VADLVGDQLKNHVPGLPVLEFRISDLVAIAAEHGGFERSGNTIRQALNALSVQNGWRLHQVTPDLVGVSLKPRH